MIGVGHPAEATYSLPGAIPAGSYHLVGDGITVSSPEVKYEALWRRAGAADQTIVSFDHAFDASGSGQFEATASGPAIAASPGDLIVLSISLVSTDMNGEWIPYGEQPPSATMRWTTLDVP